MRRHPAGLGIGPNSSVYTFRVPMKGTLLCAKMPLNHALASKP